MDKKFDIKFFVMPVGACSYEKSWQYAVDLVSRKLKDHLGDIFEMNLIEIFSTESFLYKEIMDGIQQGKLETPVVAINGKIFQSGSKLSENKIRTFIEVELKKYE